VGAQSSCEVHFGGPECPAGQLRDLLSERIGAVPCGGRIDWVTYYFRDRRLAGELLRAHRRGVAVTLTLEERPRSPRANDQVVRLLAGPDGLGDGFRTVRHRAPLGLPWHPHLHEKLYCFSHPRPAAFIGSFNPSGDEPEEDPGILDEIGDQDRGYNALVEIREAGLVEGLVRHGRYIHGAGHGLLERFSRAANRTLDGEELELQFWPRARGNPVSRILRDFEGATRVRIAASHIKGPAAPRHLLALAGTGAALEILADATPRRVPESVEQRLSAAGIPLRRVGRERGLPMHDKFVLIEGPSQRSLVFGSFNWTERSLRMNHEISAVSRDPKLFDAFDARWALLAAAAGGA
jgi:hypothetical protein